MFSAVVLGYSEVGYRCLATLLEHGVEVPLVFTHPDAPGERRWFGSVAELARAGGVPSVTLEDPHAPRWRERLAALAPHYLMSFYYRSMLGAEVRRTARWGALNMHGSLLPRYRGRAPVNWAILNGERETGVSLHYMVDKPDAGALIAQERVAIGQDDTALEVSLAVAEAAARLLAHTLPRLAAGPPAGEPLELARGSYFGGRRPEDGRIDFRWPARRIHDLIRAVAPPFPGAFAELGSSRIVFEGSRWTGERPRYPQLAPCLYAEGDGLFLDCGDARLAIPAVLVDEERLAGTDFAARFGGAPLALVPQPLPADV